MFLSQTFASSNSNDNLSGTTTSAGLHAALVPTLTVNRPAPTITKTVRNRGPAGTLTPAFAASTTGQAGDVIEYEVVVTNSAASGSICDLVVSDPVNAKLVLSTTAGQFGVDTNADNIVDQNSRAAAILVSSNTITFNEANTAYGALGSNLTSLDHGNVR